MSPRTSRLCASTGQACGLSTSAGSSGGAKMTATASRPTSAGCQRKCPTPPKMALPTMIAKTAPVSGTYQGTNAGSVSASSSPVRAACERPSSAGVRVKR